MTKIIFASTHSVAPQEWIEPLQRALPQTQIIAWSQKAASVGAELAITWNPPQNLLLREPTIKAVFNLGAGVDALLQLQGLRPDTLLVRLEDAGMAVQMAEYALHALLRITRQFRDYDRQQRLGCWQPLSDIRRDEWPVGVLGLGVMGLRVAQIAASFEYPVAGWSRQAHTVHDVQVFAGSDALSAFLARTRILVNTLPLTPQTRDILNAHTLGQLRPQAYLINVGRGEHLVDEDLLRRLDDGHLIGATLDVFREEPLPLDHPFWRDERIVITPHIAAASLRDETIAQMAAKIRCYLAGERPSGVIRRDLNY